ncbi:hypothetical protein WISP_21109 [Willisornis vidua]|uniref:Uncharacterized protein n=1 Tax=Willisornis vidua TaxID=1566151 RepID=A0ABQ9DUT6_9PASS|nr:hypothetical protein WISP_21109 [Willisornis vidua]
MILLARKQCSSGQTSLAGSLVSLANSLFVQKKLSYLYFLLQDAQLVSQSWEESQQPDELSQHAALALQQWDTSLRRRSQMCGKEILSGGSKGYGLQIVSFQHRKLRLEDN